MFPFNLLNPTLPPIHLFTYQGIPFRISRAWNIFILVIGLFGALQFGWTGFLLSVAAIILIYFFVGVHEYGHAITAKYMDVHCDHITLYPMSGVASIDIRHDNPRKEWWVTLNGPLTNVVWCLIFWTITSMISYAPDLANSFIGLVILFCLRVNLMLLIFNLIPVHPMDGGRLFRSGIQLLWGVPPMKAAKITMVVSIITACIGSIIAFQLGYTIVAFMLPMAALMGWYEYQRTMQRGQHQVAMDRHGADNQRPTIAGGDEHQAQRELSNRTNNALDAVEALLKRRR